MTTARTHNETVLDTIGNTPLVKLERIVPVKHVSILLKLEFFNPGFSIKDRIVKHIIDDAEKNGLLLPGGTIIENTSGNTGAAVAMIAAIRGYKAILTLPDKVSREKQNSLKAYGAKIIVCPTNAPPDSEEHYVNVAKKLVQDTPNSFRIDQYDNLKNPEAHYRYTAPEIWKQTEGAIDFFIASASTGGTISGVGRYLKERNPSIQIIMPDPVGSIYYPYFKTGKLPKNPTCSYQLEGIGEDHMAKAIDMSLIDDVMQVSDRDAFRVGRDLAKKEGILAGGSTGANVWAALEIAKNLKKPATIVTIAPDGGVKYLSKLYDDKWMLQHHFL
jgi:cystathionine beta-synthase